MTHPIELRCSVCGDEAKYEFATPEAKNEFLMWWYRFHPGTPHKSYAKTVERKEAKRQVG